MEQLATRINTIQLTQIVVFKFLHVYICEATYLPIERIAGSFEHKPLRRRFRKSRPTSGRESVHGY